MPNRNSIFSRNLLFFGKSNLEKITNSKVAVVGVGGLGCVVAEILTRMGVKKLTVIDDGTIDEPDLGRQLLYDISDLGKKKVYEAKKKLQKKAGLTEIEAKFLNVSNLTKESLEEYDCVVDCLDNFKSRFELEKKVNKGQPLIHGGVENDFGQITTILKNRTPLLKDLYTHLNVSKETIPVSTPSVFLIGSLMAQECINNLTGTPKLINKMLIVELDDFSFTKIKLEK